MVQGFNYAEPITHSGLDSPPVRTNFQALSTYHKGSSAPTIPQLGFLWLDDADPNNWQLKRYADSGGGPGWVVEMYHVEKLAIPAGGEQDDVDFFEGTVPPTIISMDAYDFNQGAAYSPTVNQDVIFEIPALLRYKEHGVKLELAYAMSTTQIADVRVRLDYLAKLDGQPVGGGSAGFEEIVFSTVPQSNQLDIMDDFEIIAGNLPSTTEFIHCRLTRQATAGTDTHNGNFNLFGIRPVRL